MGEFVLKGLEIMDQSERRFNIVKILKKIEEGTAPIKQEQKDTKQEHVADRNRTI